MELVDLLDENGYKIGVEDKDKCHKEGLFHPVINVIIFNKNKDKILLQKRCSQKKIFPLMWDIAVGGHISSNEDAIDSANREIEEELGIKDKIELKNINTFKEEYDLENNKIREFVNVFEGISEIDINDLKYQKEEVECAKWYTKKELIELINNKEIINHKEELNYIIETMKYL